MSFLRETGEVNAFLKEVNFNFNFPFLVGYAGYYCIRKYLEENFVNTKLHRLFLRPIFVG